ncbi:MAG: hypothetical protein RL227_184 [Pseudomonadota bacterium]|jgi:uncharacterized membrane protein (DUF485 family)
MDATLVQRIAAHPSYRELKARRTRFGWWLTAAMMVVYYGFILLVAFNKPLLASRLGDGVMTLGMPIGLGVIVFTVVITALYVRRANRDFDRLSDEVVQAMAHIAPGTRGASK